MFKRNEKKRTIKTIFFPDELQFSRFKQNREEQRKKIEPTTN